MEPTKDQQPEPAIPFNRDIANWPMSYSLSLLQKNEAPRQWWQHTYYCGPQGQAVEVMYSQTKEMSETIAQKFINEPVLGFDMEWPMYSDQLPRLQDRIALIQLASESNIGLFHISLHKGETVDEFLPPSLKAIIESPKIMKTGVSVRNADFNRLIAHFGLDPKGAVELSHLHNLITFGATAPKKATTRLCALAKQTELYLGLPLYKGAVRTSNWKWPLSADQIHYAATDVYAGFMLFHCLNAKRLSMDIVPPFPVFAETYQRSGARGRTTILQLELPTKDGITRIAVDDFFNMKNNESLIKGATEGVPVVGVGKGIIPVAGASLQNTVQGGKRKRSDESRSPEPPQENTAPAGNGRTKTPMDAPWQVLYGLLADWRARLCVLNNIPDSTAAPNDLLEALAIHHPTNMEALSLVPGIDKNRAMNYGPAWLDIIAQFDAKQKRQDDGENGERTSSCSTLNNRRNPKRTKTARLCRSQEFVSLPSTTPPSLSTGLTIQLGESRISDNAAFMAPTAWMGCPTTLETRSSGLATEPLSSSVPERRQGATAIPTTTTAQFLPPLVPASFDHREQEAPVPGPPSSPTKRSIDVKRMLLRNKVEAFAKGVAWRMSPRPASPLISEDALQRIVTAVPRTFEAFRNIPGTQQLTSACNAVGENVWPSFERWMREAGLVATSGLMG